MAIVANLPELPLDSKEALEAIRTINNGTFDNTLDVNLASGKVYKINGTQVVGAQQTGISAMTNLTAVSNWDANTVTVAELADIVGLLITKLRAHGLVAN